MYQPALQAAVLQVIELVGAARRMKNTVEPAPGQYARVEPEKVKVVGADGAVPSIWRVALWTDDASPRLSARRTT